jgi:NADH dehydrogenase [ubiquinone] 1 alpha subcomplex assembly factor 7
MSIKNKVIEKIILNGPIPLDIFMEICLQDKEYGYYKKHNPFGKNGDFITSPEISQIFGETIACYFLDIILKKPEIKEINLIELGAGSGTLLFDILKTIYSLQTKLKLTLPIISIFILESNEALINIQKNKLKNYNINWIENIDSLNNTNYSIIFSNEFFDALPIKQYNNNNNNLYELHIDYDIKPQKLIFINIPSKVKLKIKNNSIIEISNKALELWNKIIKIIDSNGGLILTIDYGYYNITGQNSFRGFKNHNVYYKQAILDNLENMDLTSNVSFIDLINNTPINFIINITTQREFLLGLGAPQRAKILKQEKELNILVDNKNMGDSFKVMIVKNM